VFDEVDSGWVASAVEVCLRLASLARLAQVIVDPLPRISASRPHLVVEKADDGRVPRTVVTRPRRDGRVPGIVAHAGRLEDSEFGRAHPGNCWLRRPAERGRGRPRARDAVGWDWPLNGAD